MAWQHGWLTTCQLEENEVDDSIGEFIAIGEADEKLPDEEAVEEALEEGLLREKRMETLDGEVEVGEDANLNVHFGVGQ